MEHDGDDSARSHLAYLDLSRELQNRRPNSTQFLSMDRQSGAKVCTEVKAGYTSQSDSSDVRLTSCHCLSLRSSDKHQSSYHLSLRITATGLEVGATDRE